MFKQLYQILSTHAAVPSSKKSLKLLLDDIINSPLCFEIMYLDASFDYWQMVNKRRKEGGVLLTQLKFQCRVSFSWRIVMFFMKYNVSYWKNLSQQTLRETK